MNSTHTDDVLHATSTLVRIGCETLAAVLVGASRGARLAAAKWTEPVMTEIGTVADLVAGLGGDE